MMSFNSYIYNAVIKFSIYYASYMRIYVQNVYNFMYLYCGRYKL